MAIHDEILARTGRDVSPGAIYTTLGRLEERGLVRAIVVAPSPRSGSDARANTTCCGPRAPRRCARRTTASRRSPWACCRNSATWRKADDAHPALADAPSSCVDPTRHSSGTTWRRCTRAIARGACRRRGPAGSYARMAHGLRDLTDERHEDEHAKRLHAGSATSGARAACATAASLRSRSARWAPAWRSA